MANQHDNIISVDVETSGPIPGEYSLLSIGACTLSRDDDEFYVELQPITDNAVPEALTITGFSLDALKESGMPPMEAMSAFRDWVLNRSNHGTPVFAGFNVGFDWSFVNWYFHHFLGANPFGFTALDIKSYYMGFAGCEWPATRSSQIPEEFQPKKVATHNALDDAKYQAEMFERILGFQGDRPK